MICQQVITLREGGINQRERLRYSLDDTEKERKKERKKKTQIWN